MTNNCCHDCAHGLAGIPAAQQTALDKYVLSGSIIEWGGRVRWAEDNSIAAWHEDLQAKIKDALWAHGGFSWVDAGNIGGFREPYISIVVTTQTDFGQLRDVLGTIEGAIYQAGFLPDTNNFWVKSIPTIGQNNAAVAQPNAGVGLPAPKTPDGSGKTFCETFPIFCPSNDGSEDSFLDKAAGWLNVKPTEAAIIGAGALFVAIVVVKKLKIL